MNLKRLSFFLLIVFCTFNLTFAQDYNKKIDDLVSIYNDYQQFNGTVLYANADGIVFEKGYGLANREWDIPNSIDTKFRLGSISKQFTAMVIMQLVSESKIELEKTLSDYLPYYRKDVGQKVTIHQLLNHTSGIPSYTSKQDFFGKTSKKYYSPKDFVIEHCSDDLNFEPGSEWSYNNSGYFILGAIIEEITGMSYEENLQQRIFTPLDMNESGYDHHATIIPKRASGYTKIPTGFINAQWIDMSLPYAAGSLYSTVTDLYKWDRSLYTEKLLSDELKTKMMTPYTRNYGYGFSIETVTLRNGDSVHVVQHGGGINGFNTMIFRMVDTKELIVLLNNTPGADLHKFSVEILHIINGQDYEPPKQSIAIFLAEYIEEEGSENISAVYNELKETAQDKYNFSERDLNRLGYDYLQNDKLEPALAIFALNVKEYPNSSNVYDSMGEALMKNGDNKDAIANYKKSLELDPRNENAVSKLKELGVEIETEEDVTVPVEILKKYIGEYELAPNFILTVTLEDNQLFTKATGQDKFPVFPSSETKFYLKVVKAEIEFNLDEENNVKSLTLYQNGQVMEAKKTK